MPYIPSTTRVFFIAQMAPGENCLESEMVRKSSILPIKLVGFGIPPIYAFFLRDGILAFLPLHNRCLMLGEDGYSGTFGGKPTNKHYLVGGFNPIEKY